jgi:hypothetical protein
MSLRSDLISVAKHIESKTDGGFVLFLQQNRQAAYISNARRADTMKLLREWLGKTNRVIRETHKSIAESASNGTVPEVFEDPDTQAQNPFDQYDRLKLERLCANLGDELGRKAKLVLFLFDFEPGGSMAHWSNIPNMTQVVSDWLAGKRR